MPLLQQHALIDGAAAGTLAIAEHVRRDVLVPASTDRACRGPYRRCPQSAVPVGGVVERSGTLLALGLAIGQLGRGRTTARPFSMHGERRLAQLLGQLVDHARSAAGSYVLAGHQHIALWIRDH